jgi:threonine dehydratase
LTNLDFSFADVLRAARTLAPHLRKTPLRPARSAGKGKGAVLLKLECWQPTGSFKVRGALNLIASLSTAELQRGLVAASAGNHALGVANAVAALGLAVKATLFVPRSAPQAKVERLRAYPVQVELVDGTYEETQAQALAFRAQHRATFVHAYDDARTAAGAGTAGLEVMLERPDVDTLVVAVGGGGLIAGVATAAKAIRPDVRIVAVQAEASPSLRESLRQGRALLEYEAGATIADGVAGGIGLMAFTHRHLIDEDVLVNETELEDAVLALLMEDHVVAEGAGALGIAAIRTGQVALRGTTAVIVSGGNIGSPVLARIAGLYQ